MTKEENIKAILECNFAGFKEEIINTATKRICELEQEPKWIPVTERLPEEIFGCLVTVWDANPKTGEEFENILPEFVGYDGETWNGTMEVEANMVDKAMMRAFGCEEVDKIRRALFDLEELKEIAGYLLVYCNTHKEGAGNEQ